MFVLLLVLLAIGWTITAHLFGLLLMLALAAFVAYGANRLVAGSAGTVIPWGWPGLALVGVAGGWLGVALFGQFGPRIFGLWIGPAFVGALLLTLVLTFFARRRAY